MICSPVPANTIGYSRAACGISTAISGTELTLAAEAVVGPDLDGPVAVAGTADRHCVLVDQKLGCHGSLPSLVGEWMVRPSAASGRSAGPAGMQELRRQRLLCLKEGTER